MTLAPGQVWEDLNSNHRRYEVLSVSGQKATIKNLQTNTLISGSINRIKTQLFHAQLVEQEA